METKLMPITAYPVLFFYCKKYFFFFGGERTENIRRRKDMQKELNSNIIYKL